MKKFVKNVAPEWAITVSHDTNFEIATVSLEHNGNVIRHGEVHELMSIVLQPPEQFTSYQEQKAYSYYQHYASLSHAVLMNPDELIQLGFDVVEVQMGKIPSILEKYIHKYIARFDGMSIVIGVVEYEKYHTSDTIYIAIVDDDMNVMYSITQDPATDLEERDYDPEFEYDEELYKKLVQRVVFIANHLFYTSSMLSYCRTHMEKL